MEENKSVNKSNKNDILVLLIIIVCALGVGLGLYWNKIENRIFVTKEDTSVVEDRPILDFSMGFKGAYVETEYKEVERFADPAGCLEYNGKFVNRSGIFMGTSLVSNDDNEGDCIEVYWDGKNFPDEFKIVLYCYPADALEIVDVFQTADNACGYKVNVKDENVFARFRFYMVDANTNIACSYTEIGMDYFDELY